MDCWLEELELFIVLIYCSNYSMLKLVLLYVKASTFVFFFV